MSAVPIANEIVCIWPAVRLTGGGGFGVTRIEKGESTAEIFSVIGSELFAGVRVMLAVFVPGLSAPAMAVIVRTDGVAEAMPLAGDT